MGGMNHAARFGAKKGTTYEALPETLTRVTDERHYLYDPRVRLPYDESIVQSMVEFGWLPGSCGEVVTDGERRLIAKGRQRHSSAIEANKRRKKLGLAPILYVYALREKGTTERQSFDSGLLENSARVEWGPLSKATAAAEMRDRGYPDTRIEFLARIPKGEIERHLLILKCCPDVQAAIDAGELAIGDAARLSKLSTEDQMQRLAALRGATSKVEKKAAIKGKPSASRGPKVRARKVVERLYGANEEKALNKHGAALLRWVMGVDDALDGTGLVFGEKEAGK